MLRSSPVASFFVRPTQRGQAALAMVFVIGGIVIFASLAMAFLAISFLNATTGVQSANLAQAVAMGGLSDALMKLARDKDASSTAQAVPLDGTYSATVSITQNSPVAGQATIISAATVRNNTRQIRAMVSIVTSTGQIDLLRWELQ